MLMHEVLEKTITNWKKNNRLILKTQQTFKRERCNVSTEEVNKSHFSADDDKIIQSINFAATYAYRKCNDLSI